jgi:hypothetical protein
MSGAFSIIGYFHICQRGNWQKSFRMIIEPLIQSGLFAATKEIRFSILTDLGIPETTDHPIWTDPKVQIVYVGSPDEYERPTLLHMRNSAETDAQYTKYFYLHTKGIRWFETPIETFVIDWINLLIYWNIERWIDAENILNKYDTYGCNYYNGNMWPTHYSGNFFWTTKHHLQTLPITIGAEYNDPEFWLCSSGTINGKANSYNAFSSNLEGMGHYVTPYPEYLYRNRHGIN